MIAAILFGLLFIIVVSFVCVFIFYILSPSLKKQEIPFEHSLISETELLEKSNFEEFPSATENKAVVLCSPEKNCGKKRLDYNGSKNCALFFSVFDTEYNCKYICAGFGDCIKSCPRGALSIKNKTAVVSSLCNGCGKCVDSCPHKIIKLIPAATKKVPLCNSPFSEKTECSEFLSEKEILPFDKRGFKFWKKCYTIFCKR